MRAILTSLVFLLALPASSQETPTEIPWGPLKMLEGRWEGAVDGKLGTGTAIRVYSFVLDGKYLMMRHASVRPEQEKSPSGDHHREISIFSYDSVRETVVHREFMIEGVVSQSTCDLTETKIVCTAELVESGPGIRARLTLELDGAHAFHETYELAFPDDAELQHYFSVDWKRLPELP